MNLKILKKDLKRKKSMNIILLIFIVLAVTFISSSLNNLVVVLQGTDSYFEKAQLADYILMTPQKEAGTEDKNDENIVKFLDEQKTVKRYAADECLYPMKGNVSFPDGREVVLNASMVFSSHKIEQQKFFDMTDKEITQIEDGTIYIPVRFMEDNGLEEGDTLIMSAEDGDKKEFTILGTFKDAFMGSDMMSLNRYLISENDYREMRQSESIARGMLYSVWIDNLKEFEKACFKADISVLFGGGQPLIKITYIMEMVIAAVLLLVSVCLILISIVMLRFIILFTINEDYKEIGIMKAIGITDRAIRRLFAVKYLLMSAVGAALGFALGIPFGRMLLEKAVKMLVVEKGTGGIILQLVSSIAVALVITLFAYLSTGKIKKLTPMDAIRSGNNGERFKRKGILNLSRSKLRVTTFLAGNDVISELKKYLAVLITSVVGIWLVLMPINTINTLRSEQIGSWFGFQPCDAWIIDDEAMINLVAGGERQNYYDYMDEIEQTLAKAGIGVKKTFTEVRFRFRIRKGDLAYNAFGTQGLKTDMDKYIYEEGVVPKYANEVALTYNTAEKVEAGIGDTIYVTTHEGEKEFIVTALYQTLDNMGEGMRFCEEAEELEYLDASAFFGIQVVFDKEMDKAEKEEVFRKMKELYPKARVETTQEFLNSMIGSISERLDSFKLLILLIVVAINVLVVILMQKMFLIKEQGEMVMLKSVGFSDRAIISWQTKRIMFVLFVGILLGVLTSTPFTRLTSGPVFKIMGAGNVEFVINPLEVYAVYPLAVFVITIAACVVTMHKVKKLSVREINSIE